MRSLNDYKIIINKGKTKEKVFLFLSAKEFIIMTFAGIGVDRLCSLFASELFALIIAVGVAFVIALMCFEIPADHLSVYQHLILAYNYYFKTIKNYYYFRKDIAIEREVDEDAFQSDYEEKEERYKANKKTRKKYF